ncbi:MAG: hypothetical protein DHS20C01_22020 [marine bacterium B5-7]|nr:MAG: hypothetical protein DHS20C01_22020 [marine bacterium B5-7]
MNVKHLCLFLAASCTAFSLQAQSAERTGYPTLDTPPHYDESYYPDIRPVEDQTQAAYLLVLLNLVDPVEGVDPDEVAPPEHLEEIGLSKVLYDVLGVSIRQQSFEKLASGYGLEPGRFAPFSDDLLQRQREVARKISEDPNLSNIAELAVISFHHPDPLVRVAAAPLVLVTTDGRDRALDTLREGSRSDDARIRPLALTLLARYSPRDSALVAWRKTQPTDPGQMEEPGTTLVIHGTWARNNDWWQDDGNFFEYLQHDVPVDDLFLGDDPFAWSGDWDHDERVQAASDLVSWMTAHGETCVDIIAHSHGANAAFIAASQLDYGRLIVLSTPSHKTKYPTDPDTPILSIRVKLDLVVLADGGGNRFPAAPNIKEEYIGWFNHSATHYPDEWEEEGVPGIMPPGQCSP